MTVIFELFKHSKMIQVVSGAHSLIFPLKLHWNWPFVVGANDCVCIYIYRLYTFLPIGANEQSQWTLFVH